MLGQEASSHTVCSLCSRDFLDLVEARGGAACLHADPVGLLSTSPCSTLIGMRDSLAQPSVCQGCGFGGLRFADDFRSAHGVWGSVQSANRMLSCWPST